MAVSGSGRVFFPPEVCRMKFRSGMPGMWQWLCAELNNEAKILVEADVKTMPRSSLTALFCSSANNVSPQDTCLPPVGRAVEMKNVAALGQKEEMSAGGNVTFMTPELSPQAEESGSAQWEFSGWKLESWAASPVCTEHSHFVITKEALNITRGYLASSSRRGGVRRQQVDSLMHPLQIRLHPQMFNIKTLPRSKIRVQVRDKKRRLGPSLRIPLG